MSPTRSGLLRAPAPPTLSATLNQNNMHTYSNLLRILNGRDTRKGTGTATTIRRLPHGEVVVRYHATDILIAHPDGNVVLNSGGWRTATTKKKINQYLFAAHIYQAAGVWYLVGSNHTAEFFDGITLRIDNEVVAPAATLSQ